MLERERYWVMMNVAGRKIGKREREREREREE